MSSQRPVKHKTLYVVFFIVKNMTENKISRALQHAQNKKPT